MRKSYLSVKKTAFLIAILISVVSIAKGQNSVPEMNAAGSIDAQMKYVEEHTRIYDNFRAIREDMFQGLKRNINDSLSADKKKLNTLNAQHYKVNSSVDSLRTSLETTRTSLEQITNTKESISFLGMEINKGTYNTIVWTLIFGLLILMGIGYLLFNRNRIITVNTKKDLEDLKREFEAYRKTSREAREKADMAHFNEIQKLRGRS